MTFNQLDSILEEMNINTHQYQEPKPCCDNPRIVHKTEWDVCVNCGTCMDLTDIIIKRQFLNPRYQLTTSIGGGGKYKNVRRLHTWANYDYRENMANRNYKEMRDMGYKLNLHQKIMDNACYIYKGIYINKNVSSRNKIKRSLYVYCIYRSCMDYKKSINIIDLLNENELSIDNYNKAISKVEDENKLFLNVNMIDKMKIATDNWDIDFTLMDLITLYNKNIRISKGNKLKLNNNSILIGSIYVLLKIEENKEEKKFLKQYNITFTTIKKFIKILKLN